MNTEQLKNIGLTEGEIKVYISLLKLGESTKTPIAYSSGVSTSKVYDILERLIEKGLVTSIIKNNVKYFQSTHPAKLKDYLEKKKSEISKEEKIVNNLIPQLSQIFEDKKNPFSTKLYEGFEGIRTVIDNLLKDPLADEWVGMGVVSSKNKVFNRKWVHWHKERAKKGLKARLIFSESKKTAYYNDLQKIPHTTIKRITLFTPSAMAIIGNKMLIFDYRTKPLCIEIENENISKSFKEFFESIWKIAKQ